SRGANSRRRRLLLGVLLPSSGLPSSASLLRRLSPPRDVVTRHGGGQASGGGQAGGGGCAAHLSGASAGAGHLHPADLPSSGYLLHPISLPVSFLPILLPSQIPCGRVTEFLGSGDSFLVPLCDGSLTSFGRCIVELNN
ncbi:unnamed protein product, partial [Urochloa humidicola]